MFWKFQPEWMILFRVILLSWLFFANSVSQERIYGFSWHFKSILRTIWLFLGLSFIQIFHSVKYFSQDVPKTKSHYLSTFTPFINLIFIYLSKDFKMNNTTTASPHTNATFTYPLDYYYAFFVDPVTVVRIYQIAYPITFLLGFIGNTASLITFSRSSLRKVSTSCLFIMLAISDTFYLLMCIFDFVEFGLKVIVPQYCSLSKTYLFIAFSS